MEQAVVQTVRQERKEYKGTGGEVAKESASPKQKAYIAVLAKAAGMKIDVSTIDDKEKATRLIDGLKLLNARMNGNGFYVRDRRVAFGLATKLIFASYLRRETDPAKWSRSQFWSGVRNFYADYLEQQELAVVGSWFD